MIGLVTMLVTTLGATGMGSILKIAGGMVQSFNEAREKKAERELARDLAISGQAIDFQKATFGETDASTAKFTRATRRFIALLGMFNFFVISVLCTIWPDVELITFTPPEQKATYKFLFGLFTIPIGEQSPTTAITTGHITLVSITTLGAIIGFYFTPGGKK